MPTVDQVWRQALPGGTEIAGGRDGLYNEVPWVVTLRPTPPGFDSLRGGELALIDTATAQRLGASLAALVTSLAERGAGSVAVLGNVPPEVVGYADQRKLPVFRLPSGSDLAALEKRITEMVTEERLRLYQREQELTQTLMGLALAGAGAAAIVDRLAELTGREVILLGTDMAPEAASGAADADRLVKRLARLLSPPPASIIGAALGEAAAFVGPVTGREGRTAAYLSVSAPAAELEESDRLAVKVCALALAVEMSRRQAVADTEDRFRAEMVESLLSGELSERAESERAERLGLDQKLSYVGIAVQVAGQRPDALARRARRLFPEALCHPRGDTLVLLRPVAQDSPSALRRVAREVAQRLAEDAGAPVSLGIGRSYAGLGGLRTSFQEAERALAMGRRLFGPGSVSFFGDLGVYRLLLSVHLQELEAFYQEHLGPLAEYDRKHGGELMRTLAARMETATLAETAEMLHIHRNTLLYRLQRISDIAHVDLDDGDVRLTLYLALKAAEVLRAA